MATYAIGDIQGCFTSLQRLVEKIGYRAAKDRLLLAGDLINRGPGSLDVLRWARDQGDSVQAVLGNHEIHLLGVAEGVAMERPRDTLTPILEAGDAEELIAYVRGLPLMLERDGWVMVHAGLLPQWSVRKAARLAREAEQALRGADRKQVLRDIRGAQPDRWQDDLTGFERLRVIVNALTRLRFCSAEGQLEFAHSGPPHKAPPGFMPWFQVPGRKSADSPILCGHWAALGLHMEPTLIALDSGCVWGNSLTAVRLEDRAIFQVECEEAME